ncbi:MAG: hypothetical protein PHC28_12270 [Flavobacterium sp.]|uniref:hypothetical protein n=1 Tax=Flavobacterium sp. TaxID=239 RepID=UPI00262BF194|nr:hypothetical protein [Flavobacterium sp.]MDD5151229.1 hypothetical protein [Flavobacterium sp.]
MLYKIDKFFISGILKGITLSEITSVEFSVGDEINGIGGSKYRIISVETIE